MKLDAALQEYMKLPHVKESFSTYCQTVGAKKRRQSADKYLEEAKRAILESLPSALSAKINVMIDGTKQVDKNGNQIITFDFDKRQLHRSSLYEEEYENGIDDIVALFSKGYKARNYVYGWWDGHGGYGDLGRNLEWSSWIRSRIQRSPDPFILMAVAKFNEKHKDEGVMLKLTDDRYLPRTGKSLFSST